MQTIWGPNRQSIRLREFDYASDGIYFITIVTQGRQETFGTIHRGIMRLSLAGEMVQTAWLKLSRYDPRVMIDELIVMPNHLHGTVGIGIDSEWNRGRPQGAAPTNGFLSIPNMMDRFKSWTTHQYMDGVKMNGWLPFRKRLWQRGYYERIIRNEADLARIREYIRANPQNWETDPENPVGAAPRGRPQWRFDGP